MQIKCMKCLHKSERSEVMMDLTVEIGGDIGSLEEALAQYTAYEVLDGENLYFCGRYLNVVLCKPNTSKTQLVPSFTFLPSYNHVQM